MDIKPNTIINANILDILPKIPNATFSAVITDAPYQQEAHGRGFAGKRQIYKKMAAWTNMDNDWYNDDILDEYVRICKFPNLFLFGGKRDVYKMLDYAVRHDYEYWIIPICKKTPIPFTNNTWLSGEYGIHIVDRRLDYSKDYHMKIPYFFVGNQKTTGHPNEKDLSMMKRIIANITQKDDFVFDGFMGSGTTAVACAQLSRNFFGCEINEDVYNKSLKRIDESNNKLSLFEEVL